MKKYLQAYNYAFKALNINTIIENSAYTLCTSLSSDNIYWNYACLFDIHKNQFDDSLIKIESYFKERSLSSTFWICKGDNPKDISQRISIKNYIIKGTDIWMKLKRMEIPIRKEYIIVERVLDENLLDTFFLIYNTVWPGEDAYLKRKESFRKKLFKMYDGVVSNLYIIFSDTHKPIGIIGYKEANNIGFLNSLAILPEYRGKGYAHHLIATVINTSKVDEIIVQYDKEESLGLFYKKLGFEPLGEVSLYSKDFLAE